MHEYVEDFNFTEFFEIFELIVVLLFEFVMTLIFINY